MPDCIDYSKYVGIPFKDHGRNTDGFDCYGLVRYILAVEFNKYLPNFVSYDTATDTPVVGGLFASQKDIHAIEVQSPQEGDAVLYRFRGYPSHVGLYIGSGRIIHVIRGANVCIVGATDGRLKGRLDGYYRIKTQGIAPG